MGMTEFNPDSPAPATDPILKGDITPPADYPFSAKDVRDLMQGKDVAIPADKPAEPAEPDGPVAGEEPPPDEVAEEQAASAADDSGEETAEEDSEASGEQAAAAGGKNKSDEEEASSGHDGEDSPVSRSAYDRLQANHDRMAGKVGYLLNRLRKLESQDAGQRQTERVAPEAGDGPMVGDDEEPSPASSALSREIAALRQEIRSLRGAESSRNFERILTEEATLLNKHIERDEAGTAKKSDLALVAKIRDGYAEDIEMIRNASSSDEARTLARAMFRGMAADLREAKEQARAVDAKRRSVDGTRKIARMKESAAIPGGAAKGPSSKATAKAKSFEDMSPEELAIAVDREVGRGTRAMLRP